MKNSPRGASGTVTVTDGSCCPIVSTAPPRGKYRPSLRQSESACCHYQPIAFPVIARRCGRCIAMGISRWPALFTACAGIRNSRVGARWDCRLVRVFNERFEQISLHAKAEPGRFRTMAEHIPREKVSAVERDTDALLRQVAAIGPQTRKWAEAMTGARGIEGVRVLVGLKALAGKHDSEALEETCATALSHGAYRLCTIRELLKRRGRPQQAFESSRSIRSSIP